MKKKLLLLGLALALFAPQAIQAKSKETIVKEEQHVTDANIVGHVLDSKTKEHIPGIAIIIKGTGFGTTTDISGHYYIRNLKPGKITLLMQGLGYLSQEKTVTIEAGKTVEINFEAVEDAMDLDEVVVTSNRQQTLRRYAPTLVSVLDEKIFKQANATNLAQGLTFQPGLRVENNCQNCGFNQVRINGLDGHFSQILIDSRPIFSALAGVYGLEQIPANMIDRVEVVRGGGSALYGSSAIAGVVNIITKDPTSNSFTFSENLSLIGGSKPDNVISFNGSIVSPDSRSGAMIFGQSRNRDAWDADGDGFSEIGTINSRALGTRAYFRISDIQKLSAEIHSIHEYRRGGDRLDLPDHVASVAERTEHSIYSGNVKYDLFSRNAAHHFQTYLSGQVVNRNSYYGGIGDDNVGSLGHPVNPENYGQNFGYTKGRTYMGGLQYSYNSEHFLFLPAQFLLGAEYVYDYLNDIMPLRSWVLADDGKSSLYPAINQKLTTWSQIGQIEWKNDIVTILLGARLDEASAVKANNGGIKPILSPRITLRWNPTKSINLRAAYAKGFRAPQIFDEDLHVGVVNGEAQKVTNDPNLKPEYSHSFSINADMYFNTEHIKTNLLVEGFYTKLIGAFNNESRGSENGFLLFERVNGSNASVYGVNLEGKAVWDKISIQSGLTLSKSIWDEAQGTGVERTLTLGETEDNIKDIDTSVENGPKTLGEFLTDKDGEYINVELESKNMMRTPNVYGYLTLNYNPIKPLNFSFTANYTGKMYVPHVIEFGREAAVNDIALVKNGSRQSTKNLESAPAWGVIEHTPTFWDLGAKVSYDIQLFSSTSLQLYLGMNNILNSFQKDFDVKGYRDSGYIYGPTLPRTYYLGMSIKL